MSEAAEPKKLTRAEKLLNRYKDEVKREKQAERERDRDQKILIGAAMIATMSHEPETAAQIAGWIDKYTTKPNDRRRVEAWLPRHSR